MRLVEFGLGEVYNPQGCEEDVRKCSWDTSTNEEVLVLK